MITLTHCFSNSGSENQVFDVSNFADLSGIVETVTANVLCAKEPTLFPTAAPTLPQPTKSPSPPTPPPTPQPTNPPTSQPTSQPTPAPTPAPTAEPTDAPTTSCSSTPLILYDFDSSSLDLNSGPFSLSTEEGPDPPTQPWERDTNRGCNGSAAGVTAGRQNGGVDEDSILSIVIPPGATSVSYFYSYPAALDPDDRFHVRLDGIVVEEYQSGPGETCVEACLDVSGSTTLEFRCSADGRSERCTIDEVQFYSAPGARKLIDSDIVSRPPPDITEMTSTPIKKPTVEPVMTPSAESENESPIKKHTTTTSSAGSDFPFSASSPGQSCNKETAGKDDICSAEDSPDHFNCCMDGKTMKHGCGTCSSCYGWGELINGRDETGSTCCDNSVRADNTSIKCLGDHGEVNYDMCCKSTTRIGTQDSHDFYCFRDRGSPEGNIAYCLAVADNPPLIEEAKANRKQYPLLRSTLARREKNRDRIEMVLLAMAALGFLLWLLWHKMIDWSNKVRSSNEECWDVTVGPSPY